MAATHVCWRMRCDSLIQLAVGSDLHCQVFGGLHFKKLKSTKGRPPILHTASFDLFGVFMRPPRVEEECVPLSAVSVIQPSSCIVTAAAVRNNPRVASQGHDGQCGITKGQLEFNPLVVYVL